MALSAGANAFRIKEIVSVKKLIGELTEQANQILAKEPLVQYI